MVIRYCRLYVTKEVYDKVMKECLLVFRQHHPEFEGAQVTNNHIVNQMAEHYLDGEDIDRS